MRAIIELYGRCPTCGYRNRGVRIGNARPGMCQLRMKAGSLVAVNWRCDECGEPLHLDLYDQHVLDAPTTARLRMWQERQRAKRAKHAG